MLFALLHTQGNPSLPTFHYEKSLPRLPLPPLRKTLDKYLQSLEPFFLHEEQLGGESASKSRSRRQAWAEAFETGVGGRCQQRLQKLEESSPYNWFDDNFWLRKAYLENRQPLPIHSNWWLALQDDPFAPEFVRMSLKPEKFNIWQLKRAAWVIKRMVEYKHLLDGQRIPPDMTRSAPLCMSHYKRMFNMTRIPQTGCDTLYKASPSDEQAKRIVVLIQNHMFTVEVYNEDGYFIGLRKLVQRLQSCVQAAQSSALTAPICVLTGDERDGWANNREHLKRLSQSNIENLADIDGALFCISLDSTRSVLQSSQPPLLDPLTNEHWDDHLHNTAYGENGHNRWFDKTMSMSVESNTRLGMMGEHSPCDALIPSIVGDYCVQKPIDIEEFEAIESEYDGSMGSTESGWRRIEWVVDDHLRTECTRVTGMLKDLIQNSDDSQLWFDDYGVDWIRTVTNLSPDAYIQMALQLAWYKDQGRLTAVYETASTRLFLHGRTDVIRSFSRESLLFIQAMNQPHVKRSDRRKLLVNAIKAHNAYTRDASTGSGIDRHLLALRLVMEPGESSPLLEDSLFSKSQEWKLSTSGLSSGDRFIGTGFGSPYEDGYGINYLAGAKILKFGIESKHSCPTTSTLAFKRALVESLQELRLTCEEEHGEGIGKGSSGLRVDQVEARL